MLSELNPGMFGRLGRFWRVGRFGSVVNGLRLRLGIGRQVGGNPGSGSVQGPAGVVCCELAAAAAAAAAAQRCAR